jgi:hypothetical protein
LLLCTCSAILITSDKVVNTQCPVLKEAAQYIF